MLIVDLSRPMIIHCIKMDDAVAATCYTTLHQYYLSFYYHPPWSLHGRSGYSI